MILSGDLEGVRVALDAGANIDFCGKWNWTPLYHAVSLAGLPIVEINFQRVVIL